MGGNAEELRGRRRRGVALKETVELGKAGENAHCTVQCSRPSRRQRNYNSAGDRSGRLPCRRFCSAQSRSHCLTGVIFSVASTSLPAVASAQHPSQRLPPPSSKKLQLSRRPSWTSPPPSILLYSAIDPGFGQEEIILKS
nr:hypothetical protein Iba_chr02bCG23020 [Ipomoea batatas]